MKADLKINMAGVTLSDALKARCIEGCAHEGFDKNLPLVDSLSLTIVVDL